MILALPVYGASYTFTDESWIAAYHYKKTLTPKERFLPFIDIREHNFRNTISVGAGIRTIEADFILLRQLPLFTSLVKQSSDELSFEALIYTVFSNIQTTEEYISKIFQLAAFTLFRKEILEKYTLINSLYPYEYYYRFYHLIVSEYETFAVTLNPNYTLRETEYSDKINQLRSQYLEGNYQTPISKLNYEVPDSINATDRINSMLPLTAKEYINYYDSPFVSAEITLMDDETRNVIGPEKIRKAYGADLLIYTIDKPHIDSIVDFIKNFDEDLLNNTKALFKSKFGEVNTDTLTPETLRDFLLLYQPS